MADRPRALNRRRRRAPAWMAALALLAGAIGLSRPEGVAAVAEALDALLGWGAAAADAGKPAPARASSGSLAELVVDDATDVPAYDRDRFGPAWADVDRNGCDQRNDTLSAYLADVQYRAGTHDCVVETGTFTDPYTGQIRPFVKSQAGGGVDIDHLVPLEQAWRSGAWSWSDEQRAAYANDLTLLVPTDASLNRSKGSQDVTTWLPPVDGGYVCTYLERWVTVKTTWALTVTTDELAALGAGLAGCEG